VPHFSYVPSKSLGCFFPSYSQLQSAQAEAGPALRSVLFESVSFHCLWEGGESACWEWPGHSDIPSPIYGPVTSAPSCADVITYRAHVAKTKWHELCCELDKISRTQLVLRSGLPHHHCCLLPH